MFLTSPKTDTPMRFLSVAITFSVGSLLSIAAGTFAQGRLENEHGCALIDKNHPTQFISYEGPAESVEIKLRLRNNSGCAIIVETDDVLPTQMKRDRKGALRFGTVTDSEDGVRLRLHYLVQDRNRQAAPKPAYGWGDSVFTYEILAGQSVVFTIPASQLKQSFDIAVPFNYTGEGRTSVGMGVGGVTHRVYFLVDDLPPDVLHDNLSKTSVYKESAQCSRRKMDRNIKYRVARSERTVVGPPTLVLYLGVSPRHFNREDMVLLASEFNQDFCSEPRLTVLIFSDYQAAKSLVFTVERLPTYERDKAALRGGYDLDRVAGTESVSFSPDTSKPRDEIKISLRP